MLPEPEVAIAALGHIKAIGKRSILEKILMVAWSIRNREAQRAIKQLHLGRR